MGDLKERAVQAARNHLERMGFADVGGSNDPEYDIEAWDGDTAVAVIVRLGRGTTSMTASPSAIAKARAALMERPITKGRVDCITVKSIAQGRALLRHHRDVDSEGKVG